MRSLAITIIAALFFSLCFKVYGDRYDEANGRYAGAEAAKAQIFKIYETVCDADTPPKRKQSEEYCNALRDSWFNIDSYAVMDKRENGIKLYFPVEPSAG